VRNVNEQFISNDDHNTLVVLNTVTAYAPRLRELQNYSLGVD